MATQRTSVNFQGVGTIPGSLDDVVRDLCTSHLINGRQVIQMPVVTIYGSLINVSVWSEGGETFLVTDDGMAYHEVSTAAANERTFTSVAKAKCERYGAEFDGCSMLFLRVARDRLKGAIIAMASLTKEVIDETLERSFAVSVDRHTSAFVRRVGEAFKNYTRIEHAKIVGRSTTQHDVDILVELNGNSLAFDYFSKSGNAVNSAYVKLSDISRLDDGPMPIGVTPSLKAIGPKLTLISSVARVVQADATSEDYYKLAA